MSAKRVTSPRFRGEIGEATREDRFQKPILRANVGVADDSSTERRFLGGDNFRLSLTCFLCRT